MKTKDFFFCLKVWPRNAGARYTRGNSRGPGRSWGRGLPAAGAWDTQASTRPEDSGAQARLPRRRMDSVRTARQGGGLAGTWLCPSVHPCRPRTWAAPSLPSLSGQVCEAGTALPPVRVALGPGDVSGENGVQTQAWLASGRARRPQAGLQGRWAVA